MYFISLILRGLKMKISLIANQMHSLRGTEIHVRDLCEQLVADKNEVSLITGVAGIASDPLKELGVKIIECPEIIPNLRNPHIYLASVFKLANILKQEKPDIVHAHGMGAELTSRVSTRMIGVPNVYTIHGWFFGHRGIGLESKIGGGICHGIASIFNNGQSIFVSDADRNHGLKRGYVFSETSETIHNGIPDTSFYNLEYQKETCRGVNLIMVSSICDAKDHDSVIRALGRNQDLDWTIDFAGKGDTSECKALATELGIIDRCNFLGECENIDELLSKKDVSILASHREGLPLSIIESMRAKLPVIASDIGGVSELVSDGQTGYVFPHADVSVLADRLRRLIMNSEIRAEMGAAGRQSYEEKFSIRQMMSKTYDMYNKTIEKHQSEIHVPRPSFLRYNAS